MSGNDTPPDPLARLTAALTSTLKLVECASVETLRELEPPQVGFVANRKVRIGNHYDIEPPITIFDPGLGTLAFVEHIKRGEDAAKKAAWAAIERATAVRQILIDEATREQKLRNAPPSPGTPAQPSTRVLPLQVEVVLLVSGSNPATEPDGVRTCLTEIARETGYLRLVGVSVLDWSLHSTLTGDVLRRAFAWLLKGTSDWFERVDPANATNPWRNAQAPVTLSLNNYRLAGQRRFRCPGNTWLNLVHGHNGSGKSSIAEALELLLTARIQRLDDAKEKDYFRIVRHRPFGTSDAQLAQLGSCAVTLSDDGGEITKIVVEPGKDPGRAGKKPSAILQTNSFRIDQVFMDKLIRSQSAVRAELFLNAFSPEDASELQSVQKLSEQVRAAWDGLPEHVRRKAEREVATVGSAANAVTPAAVALSPDQMASFVIRELGDLYPPPPAGANATEPAKAALSPAALENLLPIGKSELQQIAQIHSPVQERVDALLAVTDVSALPDALARFESALNVVRASLPLHIADITTVLRVFQEFGSWNVGRRGPVGDFEANLRRWLELQALLDLTGRYAEIATSVGEAVARQWIPDQHDALLASVATPPSLAADLAKRRSEISEQLLDARWRVEAGGDPGTEALAPSPAPTRRWLLPTEVESLNRVGVFLKATKSEEPLGLRFNRALASGREEGLADGRIGRAGGLDNAIEEMLEMKIACEALQQSSAKSAPSGAEVNQLTSDLVQLSRELQKVSKELPENFFYRLAHGDRQEQDALAAAFNELLALMTPARWAYRDIRLRADLPNGSPQLGLQTVEGAPADLLFNTAELNASALVLFLLLAPRLPNDLRLLVLDDPLQNMDELTVITLGRALAKLRTFYPKDWTVLAFFHGEENITRIRDEAPCHLYHLPWLQPAAAGETTIDVVPGDDHTTWQTLSTRVIADPPSRAPRLAPA